MNTSDTGHAASAAPPEERMLILAPTGSDAEIITAAASEAGLASKLVADTAHLSAALEGAGGIVVVDTGFSPADLAALREALRAQPPWSALPVLVVCAEVERDEARRRFLRICEVLGPSCQPYLAERPLDHGLMVNWFRLALIARNRQFATRALMDQLDLERRRQLAVLAALPVGILVTDAKGCVIETNAAYQRIWGGAMPVPRNTDELRVFKGWRAGADRKGQPFAWRIARVLATGQIGSEEELEIDAFDGARRTILSSVLPIRSREGDVAGTVTVQVDISERARAERSRRILSDATAALIESLDLDATLRTLSRIVVTHLADSCVIDEVDEHGDLRRLVVESSGARSAEEAARLLAFVPTATGNSLTARVLRSGKPILVSEVPGDWLATGLEADEHRAAFAAVGVYSLMVVPLVARGRRLGVLAIISTRPDRRYDARDLVLAEEISRRAALALDNAALHRQAEAALRSRNEAIAEVDAFLNAAPVGFVLLDRELRFRRVNTAYARFIGAAPDEILGRPYDDVVSPAIEAQLAHVLRHVLRSGESIVDYDVVCDMPPGSTSYHLDSIIPVLGVDGSPRGLGLVITDVTRLKEVEAALREEAKFRERFIGVLAHDLRNPLHAIVLSASSLLRQNDAPPRWARTVGRIAHAADRMARMTGNLLDLARSREGGGIPIDRKPIDVAELVREVVGELEAAHPGRHIEVSVEGDTRAELDADRIAEVVSNLAGNALAYSAPDSTVQIDVRAGDGELALAVHNEGPPIPSESLKRIFMPFQRGAPPGSCAPAMRGLGLGLFIVGEITRAHGGTIAVSSTADEGTTFTVRIPRARATAGVDAHAT